MKITISTTARTEDRAFLTTALQTVAARISGGEDVGQVGGHTSFVKAPDDRPIAYLALADVATWTGLTVETVKTYRKRAVSNRRAGHPLAGDLPEPDALTGGTPGWLVQTINEWRARVERREAAAE